MTTTTDGTLLPSVENHTFYGCRNETVYSNNTVDCIRELNGSTSYDNATQPGHGWPPDVIQRVVMLGIIMCMTIVGNTLILLVLTCSKSRRMNSRVNIFIINLAIGDLAVCLCTMSTEIVFAAFDQWVLGTVACKVIVYGQIVTLASTTFLLTTMSFDRYLALCKPLSMRCSSSRVRHWMIASSWLAALVFALPQLFIFMQVKVTENGITKYHCRSLGYNAMWQRKLYFTFLTSYILVIPIFVISFCYINIVRVVWRQGREFGNVKQFSNYRSSKQTLRKCTTDNKAIPRVRLRTIKMTLCIIILYIACWTPYFITHLVRIYSNYAIKPPKAVLTFAETIALLQSALNPILYGCFNIKLKRGLSEVFCPDRSKRAALINGRGGYSEYYSCSEDGGGAGRKYSVRRSRDLTNGNTCSPRREDNLSRKCRNRLSWRERIFRNRSDATTSSMYSVTLTVPLRKHSGDVITPI